MKALGLALATGMYFMATRTYEEGALDALGIAPELHVDLGTSLSGLLFWIFGTFVFLNGVVVFGGLFGPPVVRIVRHYVVQLVIATLFLLGLGAAGILLTIFGLNRIGSIIFGSVLALISLAGLMAFWLRPVWRYRHEKGYWAKIRAFDKAANDRASKVREREAAEPELPSIAGLLEKLGGRPALVLLMLFFAIPAMTYWIGRYRTGERETWTVVRHASLEAEQASEWIAVGEHDDQILAVFVSEGKIQPVYRLVPVSGSTLRQVRLGRLTRPDILEAPRHGDTQPP